MAQLPCVRLIGRQGLNALSSRSSSRASLTATKGYFIPTKSNLTVISNSQMMGTSTHCMIPFHRCLTMGSGVLRNQFTDANHYDTILLSNPSKHVAHIELNRPKSKNAFGLDTAREFIDVLEFLDESPLVRCVVLSGNGPDFTSGVDLKSFMGLYGQLQETEDVAVRAKLLRKEVEKFQGPFKRLHSFTKPIVCVQHGLCYGLGMELAACSDIRYCTEDTKMAIREVLIGIAADVGSLQVMPKLVSNQSLLRELIYTGRNLTTAEALSLGFVSRVCASKEAAMSEALETACTIAKRSPVAVQGSKQNLRFSCDKSFHVGLDYNAIWNMSMMQSGDLMKAISAILSKSDEADFDDF